MNYKQLNCHGEIIIILASYFGASGFISAGYYGWDICGFTKFHHEPALK
jgi:hypothetical protein